MSERNELLKDAYLNAISPVSGDNGRIREMFLPYFSEWADYSYRIDVLAMWLRYLITHVPRIIDPVIASKHKSINPLIDFLDEISVYEISDADIAHIKDLERMFLGRRSACELFVGECLEHAKFGDYSNYLSIGCSTADIDSVAYASATHEALEKVILPGLRGVLAQLALLIEKYASASMAVYVDDEVIPATFGRFLATTARRLLKCYERMRNMRLSVSFGDRSGSHAVLSALIPNKDWDKTIEAFIDYTFDGLEYDNASGDGSYDWAIRLLTEMKIALQALNQLDDDLHRYAREGYVSNLVSGDSCSVAFLYSVIDLEIADLFAENASNPSALSHLGLVFETLMASIVRVTDDLDSVVVLPSAMKERLKRHASVMTDMVLVTMLRRGDKCAHEKMFAFTKQNNVDHESLSDLVQKQSLLTSTDIRNFIYNDPTVFVGESKQIAMKVAADIRKSLQR